MVDKLQREALAAAREQRNYQRKLAADRLRQARDQEDKVVNTLNEVYKELADSNYQLKEAKTNLAKAKSEMKLLSNKELELVSYDQKISIRHAAYAFAEKYSQNLRHLNRESGKTQGPNRAAGRFLQNRGGRNRSSD